jgi:type I restriction enzyme, S subunit
MMQDDAREIQPRELPKGWEYRDVGEMGNILAGKALDVDGAGPLRPYLRTKNVLDGRIDLRDVLWMPMTEAEFERFSIVDGDVLLNEGQSLELVGRCCIYRGEYGAACAMQNQLLRFRAHDETSPDFAAHLFRFCQQSGRFSAIATKTTSVAHLGSSRFISLTLPWPIDRNEQDAIAGALTDADNLISMLEHAIIKKQSVKQGMMEQLLTSRTRLCGFNGEWKVRKIGALLVPRVERHFGSKKLEVLSCTKHEGFVRSLDYFKNQVFSRNLSGYKVIRHGDIGYPANHVEEGSIGVQESYEAALVSPIYVVMRPLSTVDTYFLQRQLKLDQFRQEFARTTNASVNRRGSLRWPQFSQIAVLVPEYDEQRAISRCLRDSEAEVQSLQRRLAKAKAMKQGMMQQLLTGRTRLPV